MALRERDQLAASLALCIPPGFPLLQKNSSTRISDVAGKAKECKIRYSIKKNKQTKIK